MSHEITFRQVNFGLPRHWEKHLHWYVEYWDGEQGHPCGTAYCAIGPSYKFIEMVCVNPIEQRRGVGTALVKACIKRWPGIMLTDAASDAGEAFLDALIGNGIVSVETGIPRGPTQ